MVDFVGMAIIPYLTEIFEFPHFAIHSAKGLAAFWQHRHLAQKVLEKLAFQSAFIHYLRLLEGILENILADKGYFLVDRLFFLRFHL